MTTKTNNKYLDLETLVDTALENPTVLNAKIPMLFKLLEEAIECIKKLEPEKYPKYYIKLSKLIHGYHITEDIYDYAVSMMKNIDSSEGAKIQPDVILMEAKKIGLVPNTIITKEDIFYIANMYASDNWDKTLSNEENIAFAIKAAKGFLMDPDAPQVPGRALRFLLKVAMWHPEK